MLAGKARSCRASAGGTQQPVQEVGDGRLPVAKGGGRVVELDGARLFFPDERAGEFTAALVRHLDSLP